MRTGEVSGFIIAIPSLIIQHMMIMTPIVDYCVEKCLGEIEKKCGKNDEKCITDVVHRWLRTTILATIGTGNVVGITNIAVADYIYRKKRIDFANGYRWGSITLTCIGDTIAIPILAGYVEDMFRRKLSKMAEMRKMLNVLHVVKS